MAQEPDLTPTIQYDNRLDSYASFFDHAWADKFLDVSLESRLHQAAFDLCRDWKGIALVSRMSWLMIHSLETFQEGFMRDNPGFSQRLATEFSRYVAEKSSLSNMRKKELLKIVEGLQTQVQAEIRRTRSPIDRETIWREYLEVVEIPWALWASQRLAYGSLYHAYENYLRWAVAVGKNDEDYRALKTSVLKNDFASYFGNAMAADCLDHPDIDTARLVRNCLSHNGGRASRQLQAKQHGIRISDGHLQVFPEDVRQLFALLKDRVLAVADAARGIPAFRP